MTCPSDLETARAITVGPDAAIAAHITECPACRGRWDAEVAAIELARLLPVTVPPHARREEVRTAVLAASATVTGRSGRRAWLAPIVLGAAAACVVGALAMPRGSAPAAPPRRVHGSVQPHPGARYVASSLGPDEVVTLTDGVIDVEVDPLLPGERFRVVVGETEVEVRGTVFTVRASAARLIGVSVAHGRVDVRPRAGAPITLVTGQAWHADDKAPAAEPPAPAPVTAAASAPPPVPAPHVPQRNAVRPKRAAAVAAPHDSQLPAPADPLLARGSAAMNAPGEPAGNPEERLYDRAWEALRANDFERAASGFSRVLLVDPDSPLASDAGFWRAVALARGKRSTEALSAFRDFLDAYPQSPRAAEASAMLGWLLIDARIYDEAARRFRAAVGDANPAVRSSAQAGLDALANRKR